ncbi:glycosyltransferase [Paraburkholderia metrosideri]|uniref:D-inositol-3-phosphate glycosyltransferase n=1 Tax=Paraburkholderia metrosideri TaxID=580937 RepID=A0ABN7HK81_9BURK|nr:glycosyltransferase [Paraburkholderia metrosideri]CAD6524208.1 D-inositol-3-phosphate glycosyltransferase [Paraburkholderia metrosideri]
MKSFSTLSGSETTDLHQPLSHESAIPDAKVDARIVWFMGPRSAGLTGVGQHSLALAAALSKYTNFKVETVDIDAKPRSFKRYWNQFVRYPLHAFRVARSTDMIILYAEDLSFLIPIIHLAGGRVCLMFHHVQLPGHARGLVERLKSLYVQMFLPLAPKADLVLVEGPAAAKDLIEVAPVNPERIKIVPCPFEDKYSPLDAATPAETRAQARSILKERLGLEIGNALMLLNVGSDETRKNNLTLFQALAKLQRKDLLLVRVGKAFNATNRMECKTLADTSGINVHFADSVSEEDLGYFYQAADIYVSATLHEGFGRTVIEAQMAGTPVIASDIPVFRGSMGDTFLAVKNPTNPDEWVKAISSLIDSPSLMDELREGGKTNALQYSPDVVCDGLHRILLRAF